MNVPNALRQIKRPLTHRRQPAQWTFVVVLLLGACVAAPAPASLPANVPAPPAALPRLSAELTLTADAVLVDVAVDHAARRVYVGDSARTLYVLDADTLALLETRPDAGGYLTLDPRRYSHLGLSLVLPMATTYAVVGLLGQVMFNIKYGVVNQLLGFIGFDPVNWIGDPHNAFVAVVFWDVWQWTPFVALVLLAGLTTVPGEIEEAATLETKNWWTVLRHVQLPFLIPGLTAVLILRTADTLKLFDMVFTMTRGGPGSATEFISLMIQRVGFRGFDQGMASAQAVILLIITIVLSQLYIRLFYKEVR